MVDPQVLESLQRARRWLLISLPVAWIALVLLWQMRLVVATGVAFALWVPVGGVFVAAVTKALEEAEITGDEIDLFIPHQANMRIMEAARNRAGVAKEKMVCVLPKYGNMSAATIPVALHDSNVEGRLSEGDILAMTAFGTGFTWGASVVRW